jgi:heat shock protein HslJ
MNEDCLPLLKCIDMKPFLFLISIIAIMMIGCNSTKTSALKYEGTVSELFLQQWDLVSLDGKAAIGARLPHINFTDGDSRTISGFAGCNRLTGTVTLSDEHLIKLSPLAVTRMACAEPNMENAFLAAMGKVDRWSIHEKKLFLYQGKNVVAEFAAATASNANALNGSWELNYITGPRIAFDGLYPEKKPVLQFNVADLEFSGNSSCNSIGGKFTSNGDSLRFGNSRSTEMACPGTGEQTFMKMLAEVNRYGFENPETLILKRDDLMLMRFTKK